VSRSVLPKHARHDRLDDLLAASHDHHVRKTRRVEWIGEKSPLDEPVIAFNLLLGRYTPMQEKAIRRAAQKVRSRSFGMRLLEHEHQHAQAVVTGFKRSYLFEAKAKYICEMDYPDATRLFDSPVAHEFVDLTDRDPDEPTAWVMPPSDPINELLAIAHADLIAATATIGVGPQKGERIASH
jgi:hypothetical protein